MSFLFSVILRLWNDPVSLSRAARSHPGLTGSSPCGTHSDESVKNWRQRLTLGSRVGCQSARKLAIFTKSCRSFRKLKGLLCQKNMLSRFSWSDHNPTASRLKASLLKFSCLPTNIAPFQGCFCHFPQESHGHMMLHSSTLIRWILHSSNQVTCHSSEHGDQPLWSLQICKSLPFVNQTTGKSPVNMGVVVAKSSIDSIFPG